MSQALRDAAKRDDLIQAHHTYWSLPEKDDGLMVCAKGAIFANVLTADEVESYIEMTPMYTDIVKTICERIEGACDPLPREVAAEWDCEYKLDSTHEPFTWIDFAEWLFEAQSTQMSFVEVARELEKYGK